MATPRPRLIDTLALVCMAFSLYACLRHETFYQNDGHTFVAALHQGVVFFPYRGIQHFLYLPVLSSFAAMLSPFGVSAFDIAMWLSVLATAIGVGLSHRCAALLEVDRWRAVAMAGLVGLSPPVLFYATTIELHGAFLPFAVLAILLAIRAGRRPSLGGALLAGLGAALATHVHATGILIPCIQLPWILAARHESASSKSSQPKPALIIAVLLSSFLFATFAGWLAIGNLFDSSTFGVIPDPRQQQIVENVLLLPLALWNEWFVAFAPLSFVAAIALFRSGDRHVRLGLAIGLLAGGEISAMLLGSVAGEGGAYLIAFVIPAAWLCVRRHRAWLIGVLLVGSASLAIYNNRQQAADPRLYTQFLSAAQQLADEADPNSKPYIVTATRDEHGALLKLDVLPEFWLLRLPPEILPAHAPVTDAILAQTLASKRDAGYVILMTRATEQALLREGDYGRFGPNWIAALRRTCRLVPVSKPGFDGYRLDPKGR